MATEKTPLLKSGKYKTQEGATDTEPLSVLSKKTPSTNTINRTEDLLPTQNDPSFYNILTRWFVYNKGFYKSCTNPENKVVKLLDGIGFGVNSLWPTIFGTTLAYDIWRFSQQNQTYGDTFTGLIIGTSTDPSMFSTDYANYAPNSFQYRSLPVLFISTPLMAGLINLALGSPSLRRRAFNNVSALQELKNTKTQASFLTSVFADYRLWSIGKSQETSLVLQILFWLFNMAIYTFDLRFSQQFIMRIIYGYQSSAKKENCDRQHKVYTFLQQLGEFDCSICGDWPEVYTENVFSSQGCLDGLTSVSQPYEVLAAGIKRLAPFGGINKLDLSQQKWSEWNSQQWQLLLNQITNTTRHLSSLNLSLPLNPTILPDIDKAHSLGKFLNQVSIETLDWHNTWNGSVIFNSIFSAVRFPGLTYLDLSACSIEDDVFNNIATSLPRSIETLKLGNNLISDQGFNQGLYNLRDSNLRNFDISYNQLQGSSFPASKSMVPQNLTLIDYSGNDFSLADLTTFWQLTCDNSTIKFVSFQNASLSDIPIMTATQYSSESSLEHYNFADNTITDYGISQFIPSLVDTSVKTIDFSGNTGITDTGLEFAAPYFVSTGLNTISFNDVSMTNQGLSAILQGAINSSIESISLAENAIRDDSSEELSTWACQSNNPVKNLNLANNQITSLDGNILRGNLTSLILSGNKLSQQTVSNILNTLPNSVLKELGLNSVGMTNSTGKLWSTALPNSILEILDVGDNFLLDAGTIPLAGELIKSSSATKDLTDAKIGLKFIRWLANEAKPKTKLKKITIDNNGFTESGARTICRVIPGSKIPFNQISLLPNSDVNPNTINLYSCRFREIDYPTTVTSQSVPTVALFALSTIGIAALVVAILIGLFFLYRIIKPKISSLATCYGRFFSDKKLTHSSENEPFTMELSPPYDKLLVEI